MKDDTSLMFDLVSFVPTREDKQYLLIQLRKLSQAFFLHEKNIEMLFSETIPYTKREKLLILAKEYGVHMQNESEVQQFIEKVIKYLQEAKEVTLTIAFEPTEATVHAISQWLLTQTKKPLIIDIRTDPHIIAGVIIGYNGFYKDLSYKKILEDKYKLKEIDFSHFFK